MFSFLVGGSLAERGAVIPCRLWFTAFCVKIHRDDGKEREGLSLECDSLNGMEGKILLFLKNTPWLVSMPRANAHTSTALSSPEVEEFLLAEVRGVRHSPLESFLLSRVTPCSVRRTMDVIFEVSNFFGVCILKICTWWLFLGVLRGKP